MSNLPPADLPIRSFATPGQWKKWLAAHQDESAGLWIEFAKKGSGVESVDYQQALRVALCYGWIDGQRKALDAEYYLQRFTPRRPRSLWSQRNVRLVGELTEAGDMQPRGLREVKAAQADGRWDAAYASPANIVEPAEFLAALQSKPEAEAFYATLSKTNRYSFLFRIVNAKKPETRQRWVQCSVEMLARGELFR